MGGGRYLQAVPALVLCCWAVLATAMPSAPDDSLALVQKDEAARIALIDRVSPSVVCIFDEEQQGGGSGVLIDPQGIGITNFHVVAGMLGKREGWGGFSDGKLRRLHVLGIDPTGDVAMFRLEGRETFPYAQIGNSDRLALGDTVLAMGNPFSISEDYTPTVTRGLVTGVHRYQWGVKGNLIYSDCIQTDASINPGNSGGPLFNMSGEVVGINGRISVNTRGRFNVGFGYAIATNQIKRFIPALRAGLLAKHGTLQAITVPDEQGQAVFSEMLRDGPAYLAGVRPGDVLLRLDDTDIRSPNHYASVLGTYPGDWHVRLGYEREGEAHSVTVRLDAVTPKLPEPFEVDRGVNVAEVERVLSALQPPDKEGTRNRIGSWSCTLTRSYGMNGAAADKPDESFLLSQAGDGPVRMTEILGEGREGRQIEYTDQSAIQRASASGEPYDLPAELAMIYGALFVSQKKLTLPHRVLDLTRVSHGGADSRARVREKGSEAKGDVAASSLAPFEILEWPVTEHAEARLVVDLERGWVRFIDVRDIPSGATATIELDDYRDLGGILRATRIRVVGPNFSWQDTLSDWRFE